MSEREFFVASVLGEENVHQCLVPLVSVKCSVDSMPSEEDLQKSLEAYQQIVPENEQNGSELLMIRSEDSVFIQYSKTCLFLLSTSIELMKSFSILEENKEGRPLFSTQTERGFSVLHLKLLCILLDFSWNHEWQNFLGDIAIPCLKNIFDDSIATHFIRQNTSIWIRLVISLSIYQKEYNTFPLNHDITPENILQSITNVESISNNVSNTVNINYSTVLKDIINSITVKFAFEFLMDSLKFPPNLNSNSISNIVYKKINRKCGHCLTMQLFRVDGISAATSYFVDSNTGSENHALTLCCNVICKQPAFISETEWYHNYSKQLQPLLKSKYNDGSLFFKVIWNITSKMIEINPNLGYKFILYPILRPLTSFWEFQENPNNSNELIIDENEMEETITFLHRMICIHYISQDVLYSLNPIIPPLFQLHCFLWKSALRFRRTVKEILKSYFLKCNDSNAMFKSLIIPPLDSYWKLRAKFAAGGTGGVIIKILDSPKARNSYEEAECITDLIKECDDNELAGNLFVELMNEMQILDEADERYLILFQWLIQMLDEFGESILSNIVQVCVFLKVVLKSKNEKILALALAIISALLSGSMKLKQEEIILIYDLEPEIEVIEMNYPELAELASDLRTKILVNDKSAWVKSDDEDEIIENNGIENLDTILKDLSDPLLPVRGHGLIALRRLVLARNPDADKNLQKILSIFRNQLDDNDTYIYYGAINGLMALGDVYPKEIIPILAKQSADTSRPVEQRLKVNEALLKVSQRCGETLPFHVEPLVHSFLNACKDSDCTIRASGLSNLAEICKILRYGLHPYLEEIISCVSSISRFDNDVQVKRGCIFLIYLLLEGLGVESFQIIPDHFGMVQDTISRYLTDNDAVVCFHAENAKKYLNEIITWQPEPIVSPLHIIKH